MKIRFSPLFAAAALLASEAAAQAPLMVRSGKTEISISPGGEITGIRKTGTTWSKHLKGVTILDSCRQSGKALVERTAGNGVRVTRHFISESGAIPLTVTDRFTPGASSILWEIEVEGGSEPWSTGIGTHIEFSDTAGSQFWTTWGDPECLTPLDGAAGPDIWHNPLESRPFRAMHLIYGGHFGRGAGYSVPVFSVMYGPEEPGIGLAMSPGDPILDLQMVTTPAGEVTQWRRFNRLGRGAAVKFRMNIFLHEGDWRAVLAFMAGAYPAYFHPAGKNALKVCGLGAYSSWEGNVDAEKYLRMGGIVNWKASFDFSYMGMFIPPVASDTTPWKRFDASSGGEPIPGHETYTTIAQMARYATRMKKLGFATLNYFNMTEFGGFSAFGKEVAFPDPRFTGAADVWMNPTAYLYDNFPGAIVFGVVNDEGWNRRTPQDLMQMNAAFIDRPYRTWGGAIVTDVGDSSYAEFMLRQAHLHVQKFTDAQGIAIDRFDWLNEYNSHADDGRTWVAGRPVRALLNSYRGFIPRLAAVVHGAGKVVFCNPHMNRLDLMEWIDGVYNEFGHIGHDMNLSSFLTLYKPLICWTPDKATVMKSPDAYFQRHLLMGAFPTAPYPGNDHTIEPDSEVERFYTDYGAMFTRLHGRRWVLLAHAIEVLRGGAYANVFRTKGGVIIPVMMGTGDTAGVRLRHCGALGLGGRLRVEAWYPGESVPATWRSSVTSDELTLGAPLKRGCAFLVLSRRPG